MGDSILDIRNEEDPSIGAPVYIQDAPVSSVEPPEKDYPPMYMNHSKELEASKVVDE